MNISTKLEDLFIPEVVSDTIQKDYLEESSISGKIINKVDRTLQGRPGDTKTYIKRSYIGPAEKVDEMEPLPEGKFEDTHQNVELVKFAKKVTVSVEAIEYGIDIEKDVVEQLRKSIVDAIDKETVEKLRGSKVSADVELDKDGLLNPQDLVYAVDMLPMNNNKNYLVMNRKTLTKIKASLMNTITSQTTYNAVLRNNQVEEILGAEIIVDSLHVKDDEVFVVQDEALDLLLKNNVDVSYQTDPGVSVTFSAYQLAAVALIDDRKVVKVNLVESASTKAADKK